MTRPLRLVTSRPPIEGPSKPGTTEDVSSTEMRLALWLADVTAETALAGANLAGALVEPAGGTGAAERRRQREPR
jgi:hypothetical protein